MTDWSKYGGAETAAPPPADSGFDWSKYGGKKPPSATKTLGAPPSAASYSNAAYQQAGEHNPSVFGSIPTAASKIGTVAGKALNYQLVHGPLKAITGKSTYEEQLPVYRHKLGLDWFYNMNPETHTGIPAVDRVVNPGLDFVNGLLNNTMDAAITMPIDPLTWETMGTGALGKTALGQGLKAFAARSLNRTIAGRAAFTALNWGGKAAIERATTAHGGKILPAIEEIEGVQGAGHQATAEGSRWEAHVNRRVNQIVNGINPATRKKIPGSALTDVEKKRVAQALNAEEEIPGEEGQYEEGQQPLVLDSLTPKERSAYRQLRALTAMDWKTRQQAALSVALRGNIADKSIRDEVAQHFKAGTEPIVPEPGKRIMTPYGEPKPRFRSTYAAPQEAFVPTKAGLTRDPVHILYDQAVTDLKLNAFDRSSLGKALTDDKQFERLKVDAPELYQRAANIRIAMARKFANRPEFEKELEPAPRYKMVPENQAEIDRATKVHDAYMKVLGLISKTDEGGLMRYRKDYMPFSHHAPEGREAFKINPTEHVDLRNVERENMKVTSPKNLEQGFTDMAKNLGHQVRTKALNDSLGSLLDDPEISKLFEEEIGATGGKRTDWEKTKGFIRGLVGWPRAALIGITPGHAANEINMAMDTVPLERQPQFFAQSMSLAKKIFMAQTRGDEKEYYRLTAPGRSMGAGVGNFSERKPFFQKIPGLRWWTKNMNNLVWSVSEAIRQNYAKMLLETGEAKTPLQAGGMAEKRLVDYQYRTPLQNVARHIAPFGTYRGGIPGAVAGGVLRSPPRAAFLNRATSGAMYGDKPQKGQPGWEAFTPTAEVGRLLNYVPGTRFTESGPGDFVRGSLGSPYAAAANALQDVLAPSSTPKHWATYGQAWTPKKLPNGHWDLGFLFSSAIAGVPEAQAVLEANGISRYQWRGILQEIQRQFTRTQYTPPVAPLSPASFAPAPTAAPAAAAIDWSKYGGATSPAP